MALRCKKRLIKNQQTHPNWSVSDKSIKCSVLSLLKLFNQTYNKDSTTIYSYVKLSLMIVIWATTDNIIIWNCLGSANYWQGCTYHAVYHNIIHMHQNSTEVKCTKGQKRFNIIFKLKTTPAVWPVFHQKHILTNFFEFILQALPCEWKRQLQKHKAVKTCYEFNVTGHHSTVMQHVNKKEQWWNQKSLLTDFFVGTLFMMYI